MRKIAVIGGGYSGMAAAVRIAECGGTPVVFESARILGGRARRVDYQGRVLDNGQHILSGAYRELLRLMDVVGLSSAVYERVPLRLLMPPRFAMRAPLLPAPLHMAFALLTAKGLSLRERFSAIRMMRALAKGRFLVDKRLTVGELLKQYHQSPNLIDFLWQPLTISALNTPLATASAQVFVNVLRDALAGEREASDLLLPRVDLTALFPAPAAAWVIQQGGEIRLGERIVSIAVTDATVTLSSNISMEAYGAVIVAVGPHQREDFQSAINGTTAVAASARSLQFEPITTIYFGFDCKTQLPSTMFGQPQGVAQWFFDRRQLSGQPDAGELVVAAVVSASGAHDKLDGDALAAVVLAELRQFVASLPEPTWQKVIREKFATFACTPDAPRPPLLTASPRVFLAGDDVTNPLRNYPATLEGTVRNGVAAADAAIAYLRNRNE